MKMVLITDLDNTIYNWVDYFAPCFRGMVHALARVTGLEETDIISEFRQMYQENETVEFMPLIQGLAICNNKSEDEVKDLVRIGRGAFMKIRRKRLDLYPEVKETLKWVRDQGLLIIAVSNAPMSQAYARMRHFRIQKYFDGIAAQHDPLQPADVVIYAKIIQKVASGYFVPKMRRWFLEPSERKPSPDDYARILADLGIEPKDAFVVGDSLQKDIAPAIRLGSIGIWAEYGEHAERKNVETVNMLGSWGDKRVSSINQGFDYHPDFKIAGFSDLIKILPARQPALWDMIETDITGVALKAPQESTSLRPITTHTTQAQPNNKQNGQLSLWEKFTP